MTLRCVLFSSDAGAVEAIRQALADLGVEGEHCPEAVAAVEKVCKESFQFVIVDWDQQPEAGALLQAVRERKATARPLTLAIVSEDANIAKALQAGANSILRKPIVPKQVTDTLTRARDLLRARESAAQAAAAGAAAVPATVSGPSVSANLRTRDATLRAGEFLVSAAPATQFDTESEMQKSLDQASGQNVDPLTDLEPMASAVVQKDAPKNAQKNAIKDAPKNLQKGVTEPASPVEPTPEPPASNGPRGLQWYLNQRAAKLGPAPAPATAPTPAQTEVAAKPELLGFEQAPSQPSKAWGKTESSTTEPSPAFGVKEQEKKAAELFAYIAGEDDEPEKDERPRRRLGKRAILFALGLAACAMVAAPQAPWSPQVRALCARGQKSLHTWLNPQPVTPAQAPVSHENFGRAGDEYKLPVAESIPDATTDPSQIRVTPMVDPTAKKPNTGADPNLAPADAAGNSGVPAQSPGMQGAAPGQDAQASGGQTSSAGQGSQSPGNAGQEAPGAGSQPVPAPPVSVPPANIQPANGAASGPAANSAGAPDSTSSSASSAAQSAAPKNPQPRPATSDASIPSSLKSQMATMTPEASGNKSPETALPSIEPVVVTEAAERALAADQPAIAYPPSAKGQQGTVTLQVLVGRDGTVQDAKFLQGSLAFAKAAIDGVNQWKFKPYIMNGRPVSVQTNLTIGFKPQ
jgi:TonB family protein